MKKLICTACVASAIQASFIMLLTATGAGATPSQISQVVRDSHTVAVVGSTLGIVNANADLGSVATTQKLGHMFVLLQRNAAQEQALTAFNERQYDVTSPDFHHWLSAEEFGRLYGASDSDIAAVTAWLSRSGLQIFQVTKGRTEIEFTGTVEQVQTAFQVELHRYRVKGVARYANDRAPQIPQAFSPLISGITGMNDLQVDTHMRPGHYVKRDHVSGQFIPLKSASSHALPALSGNEIQPQFTFSEDGNKFEFVTAYDFAIIYNSLPLWNASSPIKGDGISIAIVGDNDVNLSDIATYRKTFGLPANTPTIVHVGSDPKGSSGENTLDLEMAGAAAPHAKLTLVVPEDTTSVGGILSSIAHIVDNEIAPIMSASYGLCELSLGKSLNSQINALFQQAATEGISVFISSGDQGSAGCSARQAQTPDSEGLQVNGFASSPFVTAVGGTDFAWTWITNGASTYWNSTNDSRGASAKGYIIELPWNVNCANPLLQQLYFTNSSGPLFTTPTQVCNSVIGTDYQAFDTVGGGSGGYSHCTKPSGSSSSTCSGGYPKPSWQTGTGVPSDGKRDVPDVALFASYGFPDFTDGGRLTPLVDASEIMWCYSGSNNPCIYSDYDDIVFQGNGGTSAATPYWAGIMAMIVQTQHGAKQGLVNPILYKLAAGENLAKCATNVVKSGNGCVFYDIANLNDLDNAQGCLNGDPNCANEGRYLGVLSGYNATVGYDRATGLGSVNIANLVDSWPSTSASKLTLSAASLAFGNQAAGSSSASKSVTLTNNGNASLTLNSIALAGSQADDFRLSTSCGSSLSAGSSCSVSVAFKPVSSGSKVASVTITDNASGSPQSIGVSGTGTAASSAPALTLSTTSVAFGNQAAGSTSASKSVTLTNSGNASLALNSIALAGSQADHFVLSKSCGSSLSTGSSCTVSVAFKPVSSGSKVASVTITDNASGSPQAIALTGTCTAGTAPALSSSATSLTFGSQAAGSSSAAKSVTLTNSGNAPLTLKSIALTGSQADDFVLSKTCGSSLSAGAKCTVSVAFKPVSSGSKVASVDITDNASGSPQSIGLKGSGT